MERSQLTWADAEALGSIYHNLYRAFDQLESIRPAGGFDKLSVNVTPVSCRISPEILEKVNNLVEVLTKERRASCGHLMIENFAPELLDKLLAVVVKYGG